MYGAVLHTGPGTGGKWLRYIYNSIDVIGVDSIFREVAKIEKVHKFVALLTFKSAMNYR